MLLGMLSGMLLGMLSGMLALFGDVLLSLCYPSLRARKSGSYFAIFRSPAEGWAEVAFGSCKCRPGRGYFNDHSEVSKMS